MKNKNIWGISLLLWTTLIFIFCTMPVPDVDSEVNIPHFDKVVHCGLFFILSFLTSGFLEQQGNISSKIFKIALVILILGSYGGIIEWLQGHYFNRSADWWDWIADMVGIILGMLLFTPLCPYANIIINKLLNIFYKNRS